jgi:hypothetical protein
MDEPTYVLTRECSNTYYHADGICCKLDEVINFVANENSELFAHTKFLVEADDDVYFRPDQVMRYLAAVENSGINHLPIVGNTRVVTPETTKQHYESLGNGQGGTGDVWSYKKTCCTEVDQAGWYEPFFLNRAALLKLRHSTSKFGIRDTCRAFDLSQDVALSIYFWLFELYRIYFPAHGSVTKGSSEFPENTLGIHAVKHRTMPGGQHGWEDECQPEEGKWPQWLRYNQTLAVGCGSVDTPNPNHDLSKGPPDMYDVWKWYQAHPSEVAVGVPGVNNWATVRVTVPGDGPVDCSNFDTTSIPFDQLIYKGLVNATATGDGLTTCAMTIPVLGKLVGYQFTPHGKRNGGNMTTNWVPFTPKDCMTCGVKG